ncbi:hypothetical protein T484DRAFT_3146935 [Baffinella frigidus]|nr:hypothetical protein T484DRAFT_3146935 [Cryptophyta sp. CCMP2293]
MQIKTMRERAMRCGAAVSETQQANSRSERGIQVTVGPLPQKETHGAGPRSTASSSYGAVSDLKHTTCRYFASTCMQSQGRAPAKSCSTLPAPPMCSSPGASPPFRGTPEQHHGIPLLRVTAPPPHTTRASTNNDNSPLPKVFGGRGKARI